jgi:hypothetical protein
VRVAEPVADSDNALHVPGVIDDVVADGGVFRGALDGDDAVRDRGGEPGRVAEERVEDEVLKSASETTPMTVPSRSMTGNALTRSSCSLVAISLNDAPSLTA